jgi:hypothetical protein
MKRILIAMVICATSCLAIAKQDVVVLTLDNVNTSGTASATTSGMLFGEVQRIFITLPTGTTDYTADVTLTVKNTYTGEQRTLYPNSVLGYGTNISISPVVAPYVVPAAAVTNWCVPFCLYDDTVTLTVTNATLTNKSVKAYIYYDRE